MKRRNWIAYGLALTILGMSPHLLASDQKVRQLKGQVEHLSQAVKDLQEAWRLQGAEFAQKMAAFDDLRNDWNGFQGTVDAISQQQQLLMEQLKKYIDEFDARLSSVEQGQKVGAIGQDTSSTNGDVKTYQAGLSAVRERSYAEAIRHFRLFLSRSPKSALADRAQYWLGECHFASHSYELAIIQFERLLHRYPNSTKSPAALFRIGTSYAELGKITKAKRAYEKLLAQAPNTTEARRATSHLRTLEQSTATAERIIR